jgi:hypothetical protein
VMAVQTRSTGCPRSQTKVTTDRPSGAGSMVPVALIECFC